MNNGLKTLHQIRKGQKVKEKTKETSPEKGKLECVDNDKSLSENPLMIYGV